MIVKLFSYLYLELHSLMSGECVGEEELLESEKGKQQVAMGDDEFFDCEEHAFEVELDRAEQPSGDISHSDWLQVLARSAPVLLRAPRMPSVAQNFVVRPPQAQQTPMRRRGSLRDIRCTGAFWLANERGAGGRGKCRRRDRAPPTLSTRS